MIFRAAADAPNASKLVDLSASLFVATHPIDSRTEQRRRLGTLG
jgi:hypothetical protein